MTERGSGVASVGSSAPTSLVALEEGLSPES